MAVGVLFASTRTAGAQPAQRSGWEVLASSGALVPTGAQRDAIKDAPL